MRHTKKKFIIDVKIMIKPNVFLENVVIDILP